MADKGVAKKSNAIPKAPDPLYPQVYFKRTDGVPKDWPLPKRAHSGDAGYDLAICHDMEILPGEIKVARTGLKIAIVCRAGRLWEGQIRTRSGWSIKGIQVVNSPGTLDCNFRNEVMLILTNHSQEKQQLRTGDRLAQLVFNEVGVPDVFDCDREGLPFPAAADRGLGGLGSTGK